MHRTTILSYIEGLQYCEQHVLNTVRLLEVCWLLGTFDTGFSVLADDFGPELEILKEIREILWGIPQKTGAEQFNDQLLVKAKLNDLIYMLGDRYNADIDTKAVEESGGCANA